MHSSRGESGAYIAKAYTVNLGGNATIIEMTPANQTPFSMHNQL